MDDTLTAQSLPTKLTSRPTRLLIVEDDEVFGARLRLAMEARGLETTVANTVRDGMNTLLIMPMSFAFAIVDLRVSDDSGLRFLAFVRNHHINLRTIILTGYGTIATAVAAVKLGAEDYLVKPCTADEIYAIFMATPGTKKEMPCDMLSPDATRWEHIKSVYETTGYNISRSARELNVDRRTLQRLLRRQMVR
jgi:two-component system response regulator RegA